MDVDQDVAARCAALTLGAGPLMSVILREKLERGAGTFDVTSGLVVDGERHWCDVRGGLSGVEAGRFSPRCVGAAV